jgi:hypothetical protein
MCVLRAPSCPHKSMSSSCLHVWALGWHDEVSDRIKHYGAPARTPESAVALINMAAHGDFWFFHQSIPSARVPCDVLCVVPSGYNRPNTFMAEEEVRIACISVASAHSR